MEDARPKIKILAGARRAIHVDGARDAPVVSPATERVWNRRPKEGQERLNGQDWQDWQEG
jgi:hypothetical protein